MQFSTRIPGPFARRARVATDAAPPERGAPSAPTRRDRRSGRRVLPVLPIAAGAAVLVVAGGSIAYAKADKSVTLDVDGHVRQVHTFAGSVAGLLADRGVTVGAHDVVSGSGALHEGDDVVVRHGHELTVELDGTRRQVWTTALSADDALDTLAVRDADVRLVASRSQTNGRASLPLELTVRGPAQVEVDGTTRDVADADADVAQVLEREHVALGPLDRVSVERSDDGGVRVVVNRVSVRQVATTKPIAYATSRTTDGSLAKGQVRVTTAGVAGVRTTVSQVTTVDGTVTASVPVSTTVTKKPVTRVLAVGTKSVPVTRAASASRPAHGGGKASGLDWAALARCESGGRVNAVSGNGLYYGLYQFSVGTWRAVGGSGLPSHASAAEQTARAQELYNRSGAGQWPVCGKNLFR